MCEQVGYGGEVGTDLSFVVEEFISPADAGSVDRVACLVAAGIEDCELGCGGRRMADDSGHEDPRYVSGRLWAETGRQHTDPSQPPPP